MMMFKKGYNLRIVAVLISVIFLCNTILYSYPGSEHTLRVPIEDDTYDRMLLTLKARGNSDKYSGTVRAISGETIPSFVIRVIYGESLSIEKQQLLYRYSGLKHADVKDSIPYFATCLTSTILDKIGDELTQSKGDWVICCSPSNIENASHLLAKAVSNNLGGIPVVKLKKTKPYTSYDMAEDWMERERIAYRTMAVAESEAVKGKNILIIDDSFVSGTVINEMVRALTKEDIVSVRPFVVIKFELVGVPNSFENDVNRLFILDRDTESKYDLTQLRKQLEESDIVISQTIKSLMEVLEKSRPTFEQFIAGLDATIIEKLVDSARAYFPEGTKKDFFIHALMGRTTEGLPVIEVFPSRDSPLKAKGSLLGLMKTLASETDRKRKRYAKGSKFTIGDIEGKRKYEDEKGQPLDKTYHRTTVWDEVRQAEDLGLVRRVGKRGKEDVYELVADVTQEQLAVLAEARHEDLRTKLDRGRVKTEERTEIREGLQKEVGIELASVPEKRVIEAASSEDRDVEEARSKIIVWTAQSVVNKGRSRFATWLATKLDANETVVIIARNPAEYRQVEYLEYDERIHIKLVYGEGKGVDERGRVIHRERVCVDELGLKPYQILRNLGELSEDQLSQFFTIFDGLYDQNGINLQALSKEIDMQKEIIEDISGGV